MQGMLGSIPPLEDVFKSAGMELPGILKGSQKANNPVDDVKSETKS